MAETTRRDFLWSGMAALGAGVCGTRVSCAGPASEEDAGTQPSALSFAICNETFGDWPCDKAFAFAAECGYTGIEIAPFTLADDVRAISPAVRREVRQQARQSGLAVVGLHWLLARTEGFHLTSPERETRQRTSAYLSDLARCCADLGGRLLIFGSPKQRSLLPGVTHEQGVERAVEVIGGVLPVLEKLDLTLAIEPLSPGTTNFLTTAAEAMELIRHRLASLRFDPGLPGHVERRHAPSRTDSATRRETRSLPRQRSQPAGPRLWPTGFRTHFRGPCAVDYRGWVSLEAFDYSPGAERLARESMRYMRDCLVKAASKEIQPRSDKEIQG